MHIFTIILTPDFWMNLYTHGQFGTNPASIILLMLVRMVVVIFIFLAAGVVASLLRRILARSVSAMSERGVGAQRRLSTLNGLLASTLTYLVYFLALILVLVTFGVTWKGLAALLGLASVLGLAVGFGSQKLIRDIITGLFILGEGQFDVGDWVTIGGVTGIIEEMGLRVTRIRDDQGRLYVIANGDINQVFNASRGPVKLSIDVPLARTAPLDDSITLIKRTADAALTARGIDTTDTDYATAVVVSALDAAKVVLRVTIWIPVTLRDALEDTLRRQIAQALADANYAMA
jgi:small-conductance mechanosensitive channel